MSKDIERQIEEQAKFWSGIAPPNAASHDFARELEHVPPQLNRGDSREAKDRRVYRH